MCSPTTLRAGVAYLDPLEPEPDSGAFKNMQLRLQEINKKSAYIVIKSEVWEVKIGTNNIFFF